MIAKYKDGANVEPKGFMTVAQAAQQLCITPEALEHHIKKGRFRVFFAWNIRLLAKEDVKAFPKMGYTKGWPKGVERQYHRGPALRD